MRIKSDPMIELVTIIVAATSFIYGLTKFVYEVAAKRRGKIV